MIFKGSCDTDDWSNDAAFQNNNISQYYCIFDQINAALVSRIDIFQKHKTSYKTPNF